MMPIINKLKCLNKNKNNSVDNADMKDNTKIFIDDFKKIVSTGDIKTIEQLIKLMSFTIQGQLFSKCYYNDRNYHQMSQRVRRNIILDLPYESEQEYNKYVSISTTPIISSVWEHKRLVTALVDINKNANNEFDGIKHAGNIISYMIQPLGLVIVTNGNHSVNSAIVHNEGTIIVNKIIDISPLFEKYKFNGEEYVDVKTNEKIDLQPLINRSEPLIYELGLMFEMARILKENNIIFPK